MKSPLESRLRAAIRSSQVKERDLALFIQDFEHQKRNLNYEDCDKDIKMRLVGRSLSSTFDYTLTLDELRRIFNTAFKSGLRVLMDTVRFLLQYGEDFADLCCEGSMSNPGLQSLVRKAIA